MQAMIEEKGRNMQEQQNGDRAPLGKGAVVEPIQKAPGMTVKYRKVDPLECGRSAGLGSVEQAHEAKDGRA